MALIPRQQPQTRPEGETAAAAELEALAGPGTAPPPNVCPAVAALRTALAERAPDAVSQLEAAGEPADAAFYARWLKARGGCVEAAAVGIAAHAAWRSSFLAQAAAAVPSEVPSSSSCGSETAPRKGVPEAAIADELAARKAFLQGLDASGCPVIVVQAARCEPAPPERHSAPAAAPAPAALPLRCPAWRACVGGRSGAAASQARDVAPCTALASESRRLRTCNACNSGPGPHLGAGMTCGAATWPRPSA